MKEIMDGVGSGTQKKLLNKTIEELLSNLQNKKCFRLQMTDSFEYLWSFSYQFLNKMVRAEVLSAILLGFFFYFVVAKINGTLQSNPKALNQTNETVKDFKSFKVRQITEFCKFTFRFD